MTTDFRRQWQEWREERLATLRHAYDTTVPAYPPDARWVVPAHYEPHRQARSTTLQTTTEGLERSLVIYGALTLTIDGRLYTIEPYGNHDGFLNIPFRDATTGATTYGGGRALHVPHPTGVEDRPFDVTIDFNRALTPPCAFVPYAMCALPPPGNTLPIAVEAGERLPEAPGAG